MAIIEISAGPSENKGTRRVIDLEKISNMRAIELVMKRHKEDPHIQGKECRTCSVIYSRYFTLHTEIVINPTLPISARIVKK